ncbi:hypothetical protein F4559_006513 [Saccharothrix violaceirubra]|uniref:Septum formation-related domain-containing protein n=2 Tax=Saccharothrix violaceirubra TaxID=413306 RepID=A0A7W7WZ35_9PSEU|nr:hypothetical protein [Saccharothrix violaceirubra]
MVMIGAFVGAFALLGLSAFTSLPLGGGAAGTSHSTTPSVNPAFTAKAGDCLDWKREDLSDLTLVDCAKEHLFEVTDVVDLGPEYAKDAPWPDATGWQQINEKHCAKASLDYLSGKFDPFGKYTVGPLNPSEASWKEGGRTVRCGLQVAGPGGALLRAFGSARAQDQSDVYDATVCLGITPARSVGDPVPCAEPHTFEIVGVVPLPEGDFPKPEKQDEIMSAECARIATEYTGGADLKAKGRIVTWDTRAVESWTAGSRKANCKVGAAPDEGGLVAWTGSVRNPDAPPPTTANPPQTTAVQQSEATGAPLHPSTSATGSAPPTTTSSGRTTTSQPTTTTTEADG